jgi:glycosyltransferase involved in cell wall biosynthesis
MCTYFQNPSLISVCVITYNSSKFVVETLESAKSQTYDNIELIISDDCSTDNTIEICREWIKKNEGRFKRVKLITVEKNTGIASNCNRVVKAANGDWIKLIAGDDMLLENCVLDNINYVNENPEPVVAIHSNMNVYNDNFQSENFKVIDDYSNFEINRSDINASQQFALLLRNGLSGAPTFFIKKSLISDLGGYDELMPYEDWPFFLIVTQKGNKIHYLNKVTVNYRVHNMSIYNSGLSEKIIFNDFFIKEKLIYDKYRKNHLTMAERMIEEIEFKRKYYFLKFGFNKDTSLNKWLNKVSLFIYSYLKRKAFVITNKDKILNKNGEN